MGPGSGSAAGEASLLLLEARGASSVSLGVFELEDDKFLTQP
jgi:hypothetical protein